MRTEDELAAEIARRMSALGLTVARAPDGELAGSRTCLEARWMLGRRSVAYRMSCALSATERRLTFREAIVERSCGLPPPTLWRERTWLDGWRRSGRLSVSTPTAAASLDYAAARRSVEAATEAAGWTFVTAGALAP